MPHHLHARAIHNTPTSVLQSLAAITGHRDRDLLARTLVSTLAELIHANCIAMYRTLSTDHGEEALFVAGACGNLNEVPPHPEVSFVVAERPDFSTVCQTGQEYIHPSGSKGTVALYPINGQQGIAGILEVTADAPSELDKHLILAFLKVYSNYLTILEESETDTLTGLLNRRTFDNNIEKIMLDQSASVDVQNNTSLQHPVRRKGGAALPYWLAVMDIDHFKLVNDKFGHLYGDEVLLLLSRNMQRIFRQRDKLYRFGGEEFVVVLDRTSKENAKRTLERFRSAIEHYHFPQVGKVTISIGFVRLDQAVVPSSIIGHADQALYYAKHNGRNQVCLYEDLIAEGKLDADYYSDDMQLF